MALSDDKIVVGTVSENFFISMIILCCLLVKLNAASTWYYKCMDARKVLFAYVVLTYFRILSYLKKICFCLSLCIGREKIARLGSEKHGKLFILFVTFILTLQR